MARTWQWEADGDIFVLRLRLETGARSESFRHASASADRGPTGTWAALTSAQPHLNIAFIVLRSCCIACLRLLYY